MNLDDEIAFVEAAINGLKNEILKRIQGGYNSYEVGGLYTGRTKVEKMDVKDLVALRDTYMGQLADLLALKKRLGVEAREPDPLVAGDGENEGDGFEGEQITFKF